MDTETEVTGSVSDNIHPSISSLKETSVAFGNFSPSETQRFIDILKTDSHVQFLPKRNLPLPEVNEKIVENIFGKDNGVVKTAIASLKKFLQMVPIADDFSTHEERTNWRKQMLETHGVRFFNFYNDYNQLRINNLQKPLGAIELLAMLPNDTRHEAFFKNLENVHENLLSILTGRPVLEDDSNNSPVIKKVSGKDYDDMTLAEKLQVVRHFEDEILKVLNNFSGEQQK